MTQLRVGLNPLRKYQYDHNFADTTDEFCMCGDGVEDLPHYLLDCHHLSLIRNTLLDRVSVLIGKTFSFLQERK